MTMTRAQFAKQLQDGLNTVFGMAYDNFPTLCDKIFDEFSSSKAYEEDVLVVGLGGAIEKAEGSAVAYDGGYEGWVARYVNSTIALAFRISEEAIDDNRYGDLGSRYSRALAKSMRYTKEVRAHTILNNAFSSASPGGDGVALASTAHPLAGGGTFANRPSTDADISEEALEDAHIAIQGFIDDRGIPVMVQASKLIVPRQTSYIAHRILKSVGQSGTANNDTNALKDMGAFPGGIVTSIYIADPDSWYIKTNADDGLKYFNRKSLKRGTEGDFDTGNMRFKASERYSFGWTDPRCIFASSGA